MHHPIFFTTMLMSLLSLLLPILKMTTNNYQPKTDEMKQAVQTACIISMVPMLIFINLNMEAIMTNLTLLTITNFNIKLSFILDSYSLVFAPIALFVTWSIMEFSLWYMASDPNINQFLKYLLIFLTAMMILVTANNLFQFFIGWEGVGIMSFLLIGWWFSRSDANSSALQAIIYNRIGDIGLVLFIAWSAMNLSTWQMNELFSTNTMNILPTLGLILAATGKSAQFGLHPWLPAAMEGPTPVSALLHSSTMVVAGIFLLIRMHPMVEQSSSMLTLCLCLGAITTTFTAISALAQNDIKKIIAFSTSSQLGLMMVTIGLNQPQLTFLHISTHAFFKAMLFLCSGSIIHNLSNDQDIRTMGSIKNYLPITSSCLTVGNLALMGTPFLSGFYSKDIIIETMNNSYLNAWALTLTILATMLTAAYSLRMLFYVQMNFSRHKPFTSINENNKTLVNPILRLAVGSMVAGLLITTAIIPTKLPTMTMPIMNKLLALFITALGLVLALDIVNQTTTLLSKKPNLNFLLSNQLFFFHIIHRMTPNSSMKFSQNIATMTNDLMWLEGCGPKGLAMMQMPLINFTSSQKGLMKAYLTAFIFSTILLLLFSNNP